jgi:hypothetical protein
MAAAADRLSALTDDLLQHILSFAPAREAAVSSVLSRRWRPLWRRTSVLNIDSRPYFPCPYDHYGAVDRFFRDATAALSSFLCRRSRRGTTLKKFTLFLGIVVYRLDREYYDDEPEDDVRVAGLLADPAAAGLEELRIVCQQHNDYEKMYDPPLATLPCAGTIRVLELVNCNIEPPAARRAFPCLTDLTLRHCFLLEGRLQAMVDAAPALTTLALVNLVEKAPEQPGSAETEPYAYRISHPFSLRIRLRCPTVTVLVLKTYVGTDKIEDSAITGIELDMPSLRSFRYKGVPLKLSLTSPAPGLARVDIDATGQYYYWRYEPTSRMLPSFSSTRILKLRLNCIEDIIAGDKEHGRAILLPTFPNLKLLELDGKYEYRNSNTVAAVASLLRSCPAMSELRLSLDMQNDYRYGREVRVPVGDTFRESKDRFEKLESMPSSHRGDVELGGTSKLPAGLTNNRAFSCLETSLRKVTLRCKATGVNCFEAQLAKFLAENAIVLEEMHVVDGSQFWLDHLCHKVERWRADSFRRKNLPDTAGFRVYQLS